MANIHISSYEFDLLKESKNEITKDDLLDFMECLFHNRKHHKNPSIKRVLSIHKDIKKQSLLLERILSLDELLEMKDPPPKLWNKEYLKHQLHEISLERPDLFDRDLFNQFYKYWKESMGHGKIRVNSQKAFDIRRRLSTWKRNNQNKAPFKQQQANIPNQTSYSRAWDSFKTNKS